MTVAIETFSVSCTTAQLIVRGPFGDAELHLTTGPAGPADHIAPWRQTRLDLARRNPFGRVTAPSGDHLAALDFSGLTPLTAYRVVLDGRPAGVVTTLRRPPGELLGRVATVSDLHIGQRHNGRLPRVQILAAAGPVDHHAGHAMACLRAAVDEIAGWAPDLLVVKGDIAHTNAADEYDLAFGEIARLDCAQLVTAGNHDGGDYRSTEFAHEVGRHGHAPQPVQIHDLGSWRIVVADTVIAGKRHGTLATAGAEILDACARWGGPCLITLHHQLMARRIPHYVPTGVPAAEATAFLAELAAVSPRALITSGHTHRHRVRRAGPILISEVGSTKDYPGSWGGYELYEGGVVQIVRRIAHPEAMMWNERTRQAALGVWGRWAPGTLDDRCFSHAW